MYKQESCFSPFPLLSLLSRYYYSPAFSFSLALSSSLSLSLPLSPSLVFEVNLPLSETTIRKKNYKKERGKKYTSPSCVRNEDENKTGPLFWRRHRERFLVRSPTSRKPPLRRKQKTQNVFREKIGSSFNAALLRDTLWCSSHSEGRLWQKISSWPLFRVALFLVAWRASNWWALFLFYFIFFSELPSYLAYYFAWSS